MTDTASPSPTLADFNPSGSDTVAEIKARTDDLIGFIRESMPTNREASIAITNYEQAAMWAVKANFVASQPAPSLIVSAPASATIESTAALAPATTENTSALAPATDADAAAPAQEPGTIAYDAHDVDATSQAAHANLTQGQIA